MVSSIRSLLFSAIYISAASAIIDPQLTGTWSTKSNKVFTGPGFYDPVSEKLIEPALTGISYSFTDDGFYEAAYYRAISNPVNPECPQGVMQFQHGSFAKPSNGSLVLTPFAVDGRQLLSNPCQNKNSLYTRYNQPELFSRYEVLTDPYHNVKRLNLYKFDGSPMNPMYLAFKPPQMLPTVTMNPTTSATAGGAKATGKVKRGVEAEQGLPMNHQVLKESRRLSKRMERMLGTVNADRWWMVGAGMTVLGGVGYLCF